MIVSIRGTNGSGKTTLAKSLLSGEDLVRDLASMVVAAPVKKDPDRRLTKTVLGRVTPDDICVIGNYRNRCGGCDEFSWRGAHDAIEESILLASKQHAHVVYEGLAVSGVFGRYHRLAEECDQETVWLFLFPPLGECLRRVGLRSGNGVTEKITKNVTSKYRAVQATHRKALEFGIRCEVFEETERAQEWLHRSLGR